MQSSPQVTVGKTTKNTNISPEAPFRAETSLKGLLPCVGFSMDLCPKLCPPMEHKELLKEDNLNYESFSYSSGIIQLFCEPNISHRE